MQNLINKTLIGDCREVLKTLQSDSISACLTDPPYNYEFIGRNWDHNEIERRRNRIAQSNTMVKNIPYGSGLAGGVRNSRWYERNRKNILSYGEWCVEWASELFRVCKPGATVAVFNSTRTVAHVQIALEDVGFYARDICVYRRSSGIPKGINMESKMRKNGHKSPEEFAGLHSCLRNEWEAICVVQKPLKNNYTETFTKYGTGLFRALNEDGSFQSNILENFPRDKKKWSNIHCTVKPLSLMKKLIEVFVPKGEHSIVLDPFAGSGTTLVAAKEAGINFIGIEIEPIYTDIIKERLLSVNVSPEMHQLA